MLHLQLLSLKDLEINVNNSLGFIVSKTSRAMHRALGREFSGSGIDVGSDHWIILVHLHRQDGYTQQELSSLTMNEKTSLTRILNTMEKKGLVVRIPDQHDRRVKRIYRTLKAKELQEQLFASAQLVLAQAAEEIPPEDLELCKNVLRKVYRNLEGRDLKFPDNNL